MKQKPYWTPEAIVWFIENWETATEKEILKANPGRTMKNCIEKVSRLRAQGIPIPYRPICPVGDKTDNIWQPNDVQDLMLMWEHATDEEILERFSDKTLQQCVNKIRNMRKCGFEIPLRTARGSTADKNHGTRISLLEKSDTIASNKSGHTGVTYKQSTNKWTAQIKICKRQYALGSFEQKEDAIAARQLIEELIAPILCEIKAEQCKTSNADYVAYSEKIEKIRQIILHTRHDMGWMRKAHCIQ